MKQQKQLRLKNCRKFPGVLGRTYLSHTLKCRIKENMVPFWRVVTSNVDLLSNIFYRLYINFQKKNIHGILFTNLIKMSSKCIVKSIHPKNYTLFKATLPRWSFVCLLSAAMLRLTVKINNIDHLATVQYSEGGNPGFWHLCGWHWTKTIHPNTLIAYAHPSWQCDKPMSLVHQHGNACCHTIKTAQGTGVHRALKCPGCKIDWFTWGGGDAWKNCNPCCAAGTMVFTWTLTEAALAFTNPVLKIHGVTWKAVKYVRKHSATCALAFYNTLVLVVFGWRALILPFAHILGSQ